MHIPQNLTKDLTVQTERVQIIAIICNNHNQCQTQFRATSPATAPIEAPMPVQRPWQKNRFRRGMAHTLSLSLPHSLPHSLSLSFFLSLGHEGQAPALFARPHFGVVGGTMELGGLTSALSLSLSESEHTA